MALMNAKQRRIWRRREKNRNGHTVRCASLRPLHTQLPTDDPNYPNHKYHCNCNVNDNYDAGLAANAEKTTNTSLGNKNTSLTRK